MECVRSRAVAVLLCAILVFVASATLHAHAVLVESNPKADSTVKGPKLSVWLRFNVRVDGSRSRSSLVLTDGTTVPLKLNPQEKPNILTGEATGLPAGRCKLQWQVLAADGHITRGEIAFNVE